MEGDVDFTMESWVVRRGAYDVPLTRASAINSIREGLDGYLGRPVSNQPIHGGQPISGGHKATSMHVIRTASHSTGAATTYFSLSLLDGPIPFRESLFKYEAAILVRGHGRQRADHLEAYHGCACHHMMMVCN
jgi:hypothetical protein